MLGKAKASISKHIYASFSPLIYIFRVFGIFPFKVTKSKFKLFLKWSPVWSLYGYLFGSLMIITTLYESINSKAMEIVKLDGQSVIDKIVTLFPVVGYCSGSFFGIFYLASKITQLLNYFSIINKVDSVIKTEYKWFDKYKSLIVPIITFINSETIHFLNIIIFGTLVGNKFEVAKRILIKHTPFLINIYISLFVEYLIRLMTYNLELRFIRLNNILHDHYLQIKQKKHLKKYLKVTNISENDNETSSSRISETDEPVFITEVLLAYNKAYLKLIQAAGIMNNLSQLNILVMMVATFSDLISTSYFIILILGGKPQGHLELLAVIVVFTYNVLRVLVITEPLYDCMVAMKATATHVCNLLSLNVGRSYRRQVNIFAVSIYLTQMEFSACGLFNVDRLLIATLIGGVTNYVVILLGFKQDLD